MRRDALLRPILAALLLLLPGAVGAQTIDAGMTRAQVVERLGRPAGERTSGPRTYLFFRNGCERECGMHDLVVLENDGVVDAIFRRQGRRYSGESSSPVAVPPRNARRGRRVALPPGTKRGGIVVGGDAAAAAPAPARRSIRAAAGAPPGQAAAPGQGADAARPRAQTGGDVRVPIVPRDTQLGVQPRERGKRTLPGPVTVPTLPRDTQLARPDSAARRQQPAPRPAAPRPDSSTSTRPPR